MIKNKIYCFKRNWLFMDKGTLIAFNHENAEDKALYKQLKSHLQEVNASKVSELTELLAKEYSDVDIDVFLDSLNKGDSL